MRGSLLQCSYVSLGSSLGQKVPFEVPVGPIQLMTPIEGPSGHDG
jgi:hypothetical protein